MRKKLTTAVLLSAIVLLSACQTTGQNATGKPSLGNKPLTPQEEKLQQTKKINDELERTAVNTASQTINKQSLEYIEQSYKSDVTNATSALNYGVALSNAREYERAALVLAPFANNPASAPVFKTEYAAVQLGLGKDAEAEKYAQKAVIQDDTQMRAFHYLGIALDAQGKHKEAERAFRKGLSNWKGDPVPIMNNLALNLASQGYIEESLKILEKAKGIAPNRIEIERNIRIVRALQESYSYKPYE